MVRISRILIALGVAVTLAVPAGAVTILIDFEAFAGPPILGWNTFDETDSGSVLDLFDTTGADSGIDLGMPTVIDNDGAFDAWNAANPLPSWAPNAAADDYVFFTSTVTVFSFSGLNPLLSYDIDLIVSRDLSRAQNNRMVTGTGNVNINNWNSQGDGYVDGNTLAWTGLTPTAGGTIDLRIRRRPGSNSAALNAVRIVSVNGPPTSLLVTVGVLGLGVVSGRSRRFLLA